MQVGVRFGWRCFFYYCIYISYYCMYIYMYICPHSTVCVYVYMYRLVFAAAALFFLVSMSETYQDTYFDWMGNGLAGRVTSMRTHL
jgi:hypothetical protein